MTRDDDIGEGRAEPHETTVLFGHAAAERALLDNYRSGRQHHGVMLSGPRGVGKATLAYRFARFLLVNPDPGASAVAVANDLSVPAIARGARLIARRAHPDLAAVHAHMFEEENKSGEIKVAHVRWALERLVATAGEGGWRIVLIDRADDLNLAAANALLKALEEPPARTVFILVADRPGRLLPTIRSRTIRVDLAPLDDEAMRAALVATAPAIVSGDGFTDLLKLAGGSPGMALELARNGGLALHASLAELTGGLPRIDAARLHGVADDLAGPRAEDRFVIFMDMVLEWIAGRVREGAAGGAPARALEPLVELWDNTARAYEDAMALNLDRKQLILNTFFGLAAARRTTAAEG